MSDIPKIDVHHHVIPPALVGNLSGMKGMKELLDWSVSSDQAFSKSVNVHTSILSVSTPGVSHIADPEESAKLARSFNEFSASLRDSDPSKYGFFATVPSLEQTELVLEELRYAFDVLHADGVTLFTSYATSEGYLGHPEYVPVWEELNARKAVVFVHPITPKDAKFFHEDLPMPAFEWPHQTGRTAMDLILNRRLLQFPDVKIILSHGGGTLAALVQRSTLISLPEFGEVMSEEDIIGQAKSFYFDLALSGSNEMLPLIMGFAKEEHLLFGSDYPHATAGFSRKMSDFIDKYPISDERRRAIYYRNAVALFPKLKGKFD